MTAAARLAAIDTLPAQELCARAESTLDALVDVMNQETTLLRAGRVQDAGRLTPDKARLAQDYVTFARSVQRQSERLKQEAPDHVERLRSGHDRLATQMAENLRVLATARTIAKELLSDVATTVGQSERPRTYSNASAGTMDQGSPARGIAINRAS